MYGSHELDSNVMRVRQVGAILPSQEGFTGQLQLLVATCHELLLSFRAFNLVASSSAKGAQLVNLQKSSNPSRQDPAWKSLYEESGWQEMPRQGVEGCSGRS